MSTIRVDNLAPSAGGLAFGLAGVAKAGISLDGTTTPPTVSQSFNVASVTDNTVGSYSANLTNPAAAAFQPMSGCGFQSGVGFRNVSAQSFSTAFMSVVSDNGSGSFGDVSDANGTMFGDLA